MATAWKPSPVMPVSGSAGVPIGVPLAELRDAALSLQAGGVGYYPREQFVHIDTGRIRSWG